MRNPYPPPYAMYLKTLRIRSFRNIRDAKITFGEGINLFAGNNAQGKTNLLETIYYLATGRSFRTRRDSECLPWDCRDGVAFIEGELHDASTETLISTAISKSEKRVLLNRKKVRRLADLLGNLRTVLFLPTDLDIIKGPPSRRRAFLDMEISQIDNAYLFNLQNYHIVLKQRNYLLKKISKGLAKKSQLDIWDSQLIALAWEITRRRMFFLESMAPNVSRVFDDLSEKRTNVNLIYRDCADAGARKTEEGFKRSLSTKLLKTQDDNIEHQRTSVGPHRDDFLMTVGSHDVKTYGSQGQQRCCVLSLRLAEISFMKDATGEYPVLMLDDVFSELDSTRQRRLLSNIPRSAQTMITSTSVFNPSDRFKNLKAFTVTGGVIEAISSRK